MDNLKTRLWFSWTIFRLRLGLLRISVALAWHNLRLRYWRLVLRCLQAMNRHS